ncbi:MAG: hypothetical protein CL678_02805 [Bdellovibrionaceae bacterium]|nr:hypothetical protein [Pseudobdellovibrionaceae bacterium]|tara:strand:- start:4705 stop:5208 length:504 start_codon:yes stop_codon:yes gene_type:complete
MKWLFGIIFVSLFTGCLGSDQIIVSNALTSFTPNTSTTNVIDDYITNNPSWQSACYSAHGSTSQARLFYSFSTTKLRITSRGFQSDTCGGSSVDQQENFLYAIGSEIGTNTDIYTLTLVRTDLNPGEVLYGILKIDLDSNILTPGDGYAINLDAQSSLELGSITLTP